MLDYWKPSLTNSDTQEEKIWKARKHARRPGQMLCTSCPAYTLIGPERFMGYAHRFLSVGHGSTLGRNFITSAIGSQRSCYYGHKNYIATIENDFAESYRNSATTNHSILDLCKSQSSIRGSNVKNVLVSHVTNRTLLSSYKRHSCDNIVKISDNLTKQKDTVRSFNEQKYINVNDSKEQVKILKKGEGREQMNGFFDEVKKINEKYKKESRVLDVNNYSRKKKPRSSKNIFIVRNDRESHKLDEKTLESLIDPADWSWIPSSWRITRQATVQSSPEKSGDDPWIDEEKEMILKAQKLCFENAD